MRVGDAIGWLAWYLVPYRRHIVEVNLQLCFSDRDEAARRRLARENFRYTGRGLIEAAIAWWAGDDRIHGLGQVEGVEYVERALAEGRGVILLGGHFTSLDLGGRLLRSRLAFRTLYRPSNNPVIERAMRRGRERHSEGAIERGDLRTVVRALRSRQVVWYAPDQDFGRRQAVFAPFCGVPAATITMTSRLARLSGAAVVPVYGVALGDGSGYHVRIQPPLADFPSADETADAARLNAVLEAEVQRHPAQYYWVHRRFKTRPAGEPRPYTRERRRHRKDRRA